MSSTLKSLRALSDPTRIRIVALLEKDELSVNEIQDVTKLGQSRISTHLGLLQDAELVLSLAETHDLLVTVEEARVTTIGYGGGLEGGTLTSGISAVTVMFSCRVAPRGTADRRASERNRTSTAGRWKCSGGD